MNLKSCYIFRRPLISRMGRVPSGTLRACLSSESLVEACSLHVHAGSISVAWLQLPLDRCSLRCYVDDPHLLVAGPIEAAAWDWGVLLLTWCCFGAQLSWRKGQFSRKVVWIGAELQTKLVKGRPGLHCNISGRLDELRRSSDMVAASIFQQEVVGGLLDHDGCPSRPQVGHLLFVVRIKVALDWRHAALNCQLTFVTKGVERNVSKYIQPLKYTIRTDASPFGMRGMSLVHGRA
eukprot:4922704-Amphidinium_carterae.2